MKFARSINSAQYCSQKNSQKLRLEKIKIKKQERKVKRWKRERRL